MSFCLIKPLADKFRNAVKSGAINPSRLIKMSSVERRSFFDKLIGEGNGKEVNKLFEHSLLLKNKEAAVIDWARNMSGITAETKAAMTAKIKAEFARKKERLLNPKEANVDTGQEAETLLGELASEYFSKKYKADVSLEETEAIVKLHQETQKLFKADTKTGDWETKTLEGKEKTPADIAEEKAKYGATKFALETYTSLLKDGSESIKEVLGNRYEEFKKTLEENVPKAATDLLKDIIQEVSDSTVTMVGSWDLSFNLKQGLYTLLTHPSSWWTGAKSSVSDFYHTMNKKGINPKRALWASIYPEKHFINGNYELAGLFKPGEEQIPTTWQEKIPGAGRLYEASNNAFNGAALRMRLSLFDSMYEIGAGTRKSFLSKNLGKIFIDKLPDMDDKKEIQSLGRIINSLTAKGQWGKTGVSPWVRLVMWAPNMLKGNLDVLTAHFGQDITPFARRQAQANLIKITAFTAGMLAMANALKPGSAEIDPRSSNFTTVKFINTPISLGGGAAGIITLASRFLSWSKKDINSGTIKKYETKFGSNTPFDAIVDFFTNKFTPFAGTIVEYAKGKTPTGEKATVLDALYRKTFNITSQNIINYFNSYRKGDIKPTGINIADTILSTLADVSGLGAKNYATGSDWSQDTTKAITEFKDAVPDNIFQEANNIYNQEWARIWEEMQKDPEYTSLTDEGKQKMITSVKRSLKTDVLNSYK